MPHEPPITSLAEIIEVLDGRRCRAVLPNGKQVLAHLPKSARDSVALQVGEEIRLEFSPFDFSRARIRMGEVANPSDLDPSQQPNDDSRT